MSSPLYEKRASRHDYISIDGTDYSNAFQQMNANLSKQTQDAGGFSVTGVDETVPGGSTESFTGIAYAVDELFSALFALYKSGEEFELQWQKNGLVDNTAPLLYANVRLDEFGAESTFGQVETQPVTFNVADANGVRINNT